MKLRPLRLPLNCPSPPETEELQLSTTVTVEESAEFPVILLKNASAITSSSLGITKRSSTEKLLQLLLMLFGICSSPACEKKPLTNKSDASIVRKKKKKLLVCSVRMVECKTQSNGRFETNSLYGESEAEKKEERMKELSVKRTDKCSKAESKGSGSEAFS